MTDDSSKAEIRSRFLDLRLSLDNEEIENRLNAMLEILERDVLTRPHSLIHSFLPMADRKEVDTRHFIRRIIEKDPQVRFLVPFSDMGNKTLRHFYWTPDDRLIINKWGIPEPDPKAAREALKEEVNSIKLVFVPLLAADYAGHRVGYGAGFYDSFLKDLPRTAFKLGMSFFPPLDTRIEIHDADVRLDACLTPEKFYRFS